MSNRNLKKAADNELKNAYSRYYSTLYKFCLSKLKNDVTYVDDCVQETYLVLYNRLLEGEKFEYTLAFLYKTASNLIKKRYVQLKKQENIVSIDDIREVVNHSVDIDDRLTFEEYSRMISDALNDTDREIFTLRYSEELKIDEIAERLNLTVTNVSTRLSRMREKLRTLIESSD
ncbi:MAG: RNA polymerase sigma factor [Eubacterium sp.]|nr:RNA polymerase sigma factor [Eubacterium sp.]